MIRRLLTDYRHVIALALVAVVAEAAYAVINVLALPVFVDRRLQATEYLGIIIGAFLLVEALMKGPMGALSDRYGRCLFLAGGPLVAACSAFLITLVRAPVGIGKLLLLVGIRSIDGMAAAALWTTMFATMADVVDEDRRTSAMSTLTVSYMAGIAIGPYLGGKVNVHFHSYRAAFYVVSLLFLLTAILAWALVPRCKPSHHDMPPEQEMAGVHWKDLVRATTKAPMMLVIAFVVFLASGLLYPIAALWVLDKFGLDQEQFGALFLKPAVLIGLSSVALGHLGDRWGHARSVYLGLLVAAGAMWSLVLLPKTEWLLIIAATCLGLGFVIGLPAWMAAISEIADDRWRGTLIGAVATAQGIGAFLGVVISPKLFKLHVRAVPEHSLPLVLSAMALSLAFLLALAVVRPPREGGATKDEPPTTNDERRTVGAAREKVAGERG